jgi:hypothetical protein
MKLSRDTELLIFPITRSPDLLITRFFDGYFGTLVVFPETIQNDLALNILLVWFWGKTCRAGRATNIQQGLGKPRPFDV